MGTTLVDVAIMLAAIFALTAWANLNGMAAEAAIFYLNTNAYDAETVGIAVVILVSVLLLTIVRIFWPRR